MNILFWVLQVLLSLHTLMGALWKLSNTEQNVPTLQAIPHGLWLALSVVDVLIAIALVAPAINKKLGKLAPIAAIALSLEMLFYCGVHLASGAAFDFQATYWLVVAVLSGFIAFGRLVLKPH